MATASSTTVSRNTGKKAQSKRKNALKRPAPAAKKGSAAGKAPARRPALTSKSFNQKKTKKGKNASKRPKKSQVVESTDEDDSDSEKDETEDDEPDDDDSDGAGSANF